MTRYWLRPNGQIHRSDDNAWSANTDLWTEVRVVPLDAIVIERSELPEVVADGTAEGDSGRRVARFKADGSVGFADDYTVRTSRRIALGHLAIAEHLTANPIVDETQVSALAQAIADFVQPGAVVGSGTLKRANASDIARHLIATGKVQVTS